MVVGVFEWWEGDELVEIKTDEEDIVGWQG